MPKARAKKSKPRVKIYNVRAKIEGSATGIPTPHDGRYVVAWNPHVPFGVVAVDSTDDPHKAKTFVGSQAFREWRTVSSVQPVRWDGKPNRPLTALNVSFERVGDVD